MLEILFLVFLGKKIAAMAKEKGRSATPWVLLLVFGWFAGEIGGAIVSGVVYVAAVDPNADEPPLFPMILGAIVGALSAAGVVFLLMNSLSPVASHDDEEDDEYDDRPRRRRRDEDDDGR